MAYTSGTCERTIGDGRLPTPVVEWPISLESFERLAKHWRKSRLWLSLWNASGENVAVDSKGARLWTTLWSHGEHFRKQLGEFVKAGFQVDTAQLDQEYGPPDFGPWEPDLVMLATPIRRRHRVVGLMVGGLVLDEHPGEALTRLSSQCGIDSKVLAGFCSAAGTVRSDQVERIYQLLRLSVDLAHEVDTGQEETAVLTNNLENTYEELNLVYQISRQTNLPQKPSDLLQRVGSDVLEVSRATAIAFVLNEGDDREDPSHPATPETQLELTDRVVQVGQGAPGLQELDRLAATLKNRVSPGTDHLLLNNAHEDPGLRWAASWLEHLAVLPLWQEERLLGVLLAVNCDDTGDFTSVDVQLFRAVADRVAAFLENQRLYDDLADLLMGLLRALVNSIDAKDPYTCGHSERVAFYSRAVAQAAGLSQIECQRVYLAGLLHDVGKIGVPDAILCKPGKLTREEYEAMKKHPEIGAHILSCVRQISDLLPGVLHHHERIDSQGYPHKLASHDIPLFGRIICLGDCFDAMTTNRTYRTALPLSAALAEIRRCSGTQFDPKLAELFVGLDHAQLFKEARENIGSDATLGRIGAFSASRHRQPDSINRTASKRTQPS